MSKKFRVIIEDLTPDEPVTNPVARQLQQKIARKIDLPAMLVKGEGDISFIVDLVDVVELNEQLIAFKAALAAMPDSYSLRNMKATSAYTELMCGLDRHEARIVTSSFSSLMRHGYKNLGEIRTARPEQLEAINNIGKVKFKFISLLFEAD